MAQHRAKLGRRGMAALAAAGALIVSGGATAMIGTSNADPLVPLPLPAVGTTYVLPDLAPFADNGTRNDGSAEVSDEFGAPPAGGQAALRLQTPGTDDKASIVSTEDAGSPLAEWIPTAAYSAYQSTADNPVQFPSLQLIVDFNGAAAGGFSTLTYEPVYNEVGTEPGQWHRYEAGAGDWCSTREIPGVIASNQTRCDNGGDKPLADYLASEGIVVNGVAINQGSGNPGLDAAVDLVSTPSTTYDFELTKPAEPEVPGTDPCEEPGTPAHPGEGDWGGDEGHENAGHENAGHENESHQDDGGHENGGDEKPADEGHEQPDDGGQDPDCS